VIIASLGERNKREENSQETKKSVVLLDNSGLQLYIQIELPKRSERK